MFLPFMFRILFQEALESDLNGSVPKGLRSRYMGFMSRYNGLCHAKWDLCYIAVMSLDYLKSYFLHFAWLIFINFG